MSASQLPLPLYKKVFLKYTSHRILDVVILVLLLSLLLHRLLSLNDHGFYWLLAFLCESWFTFYWFLVVNSKWNPVQYITYPENLDKRFSELPPVDMFVTTADAVLEPPIITVNTVLSLLAVDYPANKLTCYVSDDGCSPLTFYSLLQASRFAKHWVPFCKKYKIQVRAPFRYFLVKPKFSKDNAEFQQEWIKMKREYEQLREKIENAAKMSTPLDETGELAVFAQVERGNHPTIIKIIWENKEAVSDGAPHLVYISREKRPKHQHHYKAGAMNVLTRVSGLMTNAPFMLNVDCDMFVNNPEVVRQAMCVLFGTNDERESAFVQFPQIFYDAPKDDPFGNQFVTLFQYLVPGITGIQGLFYCGTGCFLRRKVIYSLSPDDEDNSVIGNLSDNGLVKEYGNSREFLESVARALKGRKVEFPINLSNNLQAACQIAGCAYENDTDWGNKVGWIYGSTTEDILTSLIIHNKGWMTIYVAPDPPAFLGCAPSGGPVAMTQQKRWSTGLLEVLVSRNSPIFGFLTAKLQFRQCLTYVFLLSWSIESIPELCYAALPAYCIIANSHFLPKVHEPAICIPVSIFVLYNLYTLLEYLKTGLSFRAWWDNQRMARIAATNAYMFGVLGVLLKFLGLYKTVFEVTPKDQPADDDVSEANNEFTFDEIPLFVPGTAVLLVHITAMFTILSGLRPPVSDQNGVGTLEVLCSMWVILCFWPFLKGLFRKGKYGIPLPTIFKSAALALVFVNLCWASVG